MRKERDEEEQKRKATPFKIIGDRLYESVIFHGKPMFLLYDIDKTFSLIKELTYEDEILVPVEQSVIPYNLPILDDEYLKTIQQKDYRIHVDEIWNLIYNQVDTYSDLELRYKSIVTATIMETYQQHKYYSTGYLFFQGDFGSGKSQVISLSGKLSYRTMNTAASNAANTYRFIGYDSEMEAQQTICEDEIDYLKLTDDLEQKFRLYRTGYKRGTRVARMDDAGTSNAIQRYYMTFCVKFFAGRYLPKDEAFKSRCIEIPMVEGFPEIDEFTVEDSVKFSKIVMRATVWRMQTYFDSLPAITNQLRGRTKEIWKSKILAVVGTTTEAKVPLQKECEDDVDITPEQYLTNLATDDVEKKFAEKHNRLEVYILQNVYDLCNHMDWFNITFKNIWMRTLKDMGVNSYEIEDTDIQSIDVPILSFSVSKKRVSGILYHMLRGTISTVTNKSTGIGERTWTFEKEVIERLARGYKITPRQIEI